MSFARLEITDMMHSAVLMSEATNCFSFASIPVRRPPLEIKFQQSFEASMDADQTTTEKQMN